MISMTIEVFVWLHWSLKTKLTLNSSSTFGSSPTELPHCNDCNVFHVWWKCIRGCPLQTLSLPIWLFKKSSLQLMVSIGLTMVNCIRSGAKYFKKLTNWLPIPYVTHFRSCVSFDALHKMWPISFTFSHSVMRCWPLLAFSAGSLA